MICKKCGKEFEGKFCPECGTMAEDQPRQDLTLCPNCGSDRLDNGKFCVNCGYNFVAPTQSVNAGKQKSNLNNVKLNKFLSVFAKIYRWLIAGGMIFVGIVALLCLTAPTLVEEFLGETNPLCTGFVAIGNGVEVDVPSNVVNVCITLLIVSIFCVLYGAAQLSIAFQEPYSKIKNKVFWIIDGAISIILIILGSVVAGEAGSEELMDAKLGSGFAMCIVMGVFGLVFLGLRIFYELKVFKWEDTGLTDEQIVKATEKKERKHIDKQKVKKIAIRVGIPVVVIAVLLSVIVPTVMWANNIFRVGKVDKINIGDNQEQVIKILGEPYEKSDNRFEYYSDDYIKLVEQIKELTGNSKNLTTNMAKDDDWDFDWDDDIDLDEDIDIEESESKLDKLYNQLKEMTYKYIRVDFDTDKKVSEIFFDNDKCDSRSAEENKKEVKTYNLVTNEIMQYAKIDIIYTVELVDGSFYKGVAIKDYFAYRNGSVSIRWSDDWRSYSDQIFIKENSDILLTLYDGENLYNYYSNGELIISVVKLNVNSFTIMDDIISKLKKLGLDKLEGIRASVEKITVDGNSDAYKSEGNCLIKKEDNSLVLGCKNSLIPDYVTSIVDGAFTGCSGLTSIKIPSSVENIGSAAFSCCDSLERLTVDINNATYKSDGNCIIAKETNELILGCSNSKIPNYVTSIGAYAFLGCSKLTSIEIPSMVKSIGNTAFSYCSSLESIVVDVNNQYYKSEGNCLIAKETNELILGCKNSKIPNYVTSIGNSAFRGCSNLTRIDIPSVVTIIGSYAFYNCSSLTSIEIPSSVISIGAYAFSDSSRGDFVNLMILNLIDKFMDSSNLTIYCEAESQPSGWDSYWNYSDRPVVWGHKIGNK